MNTSKIANILYLFYSYSSHIVSNNSVTPDIVNICDVRGEPDNEVVYLGWKDGDGLEYRLKFTENGLSNAVVKDGNLVMMDNEGDEIEIAFMETRKYSLVSEDID